MSEYVNVRDLKEDASIREVTAGYDSKPLGCVRI